MPAESLALVQDAPSLAGKNIYFSEAFKEASQFDRSDAGISRYAGLLRLMGANLFTLEWRKGIPATADLVVIPGPTSDLAPDVAARLWAYIQRGGRVLLLVDAVDERGNPSRALPATKGLFELTWNDLGLHALDDVVVVEGAVRTVDVTETDRDGNVTAQYSIDSPELSLGFETGLVSESHPITEGLDMGASPASGEGDSSDAALSQFVFWGARSLEIDASLQNQVVTPLIFVDQPNLYGETDYATYVRTNGAVEYNIGSDSARGPLILAASLENPTVG
ncbi:MAG: GldG family protein, partial [Anaerolineae bacterium]|nr:GldG family protein [Anaerolineae bacterium]